MRTYLTALLCTASILCLMAQTSPARPGKYTSAAEIDQLLKKTPASANIGQLVEIHPGMVLRHRMAGPNNASVHSTETDKQDVTEVYQIVDGGGTFVTGGMVADWKDRTRGITGGEAHKVSRGDYIVIPAGTPHWFSSIDGSVTYLETRFPTKR